MAERYDFSDSSKISEHFSVQEFRCRCGRTHDTLLDTGLVQKLEKLRDTLKCRAITINSGYRCSDHDRAVGGNGSGMHTKGMAADIVCTGADGKPVNSGVICCAAQDIGFGGIGKINGTAVHVDVRTSNFWKGDETVPGGTSGSVTADFYQYFGLSRAEVYGTETLTGRLEINGKTYNVTLTEIG
ncbi:MAG: hypothetical protein IJ874_01325 [Ruminococcus sp.]|nr:hypothetical protein [Ruminococcus sp.]